MSTKSDPVVTPNPKGVEDEREIVLATPIGDGVEKLRLREPTAGQMREIRAAPTIDRELVGVSLVAGVPRGAVSKLPISTLYEADAWISAWTDEALPSDGGVAELVIPLKRPVQSDDVSYTELRMREPDGEEMRKIRAEDPANQQIAAVALIAGVPEPVVARIGARTVLRAELYLVGFIEAGRSRIGVR